MKQILENDIQERGTYVATMGFFDGVHAGHRYLLTQLKSLAKEQGKKTLVITFDNSPRSIINTTSAPRLLTTTQEKLFQLEELDIDACALLHFSTKIANMTAKEFINDVIYKWLGITTLLVGYDHRFGHDREEGFEDYVRYGNEIGLSIAKATEFKNKDELQVSSSAIREALDRGDIPTANKMLTRPYTITGTVTEGKQIGRTIGYPTANVMVNDKNKEIPQNGVYAVKVTDNETHKYYGILNIGNRPTLEDNRGQTIEVHLINENKNLYGHRLRLDFIQRLREERRFANLEELKEAIGGDKHRAQEIFGL